MTNKERLCRTCIYEDKNEYDKPCVIYSDNCQLYEEKKHMTNEAREKEIRKQPIPTKEECIAFYKELVKLADVRFVPYYNMAIKALEQKTCEDYISRYELSEAISALTYWHFNDDGKLEIGGAFDNTVYKVDDVERLVRVLPPVQPQPFINKPCISEGACREDKTQVLDKIRAEIAEYGSICVTYAITDKTKTDEGIDELVTGVLLQAKRQVLDIIDKYRSESEE